ncbi:MAG TPA: TonB family protein [Thermoanaerobaculia bacterium]|nr:TonB family protein [Thermoanaerobaculia bacterium]
MKRALLALTLAAFSCAAPPPPVTTPAAEPLGTGRVTATALNLRAEATTEAEILTTIRRGQTLTLMEERAGWYQVRLPTGESGWVSAQYVARSDGRSSSTARRSRGCPADSDYAFEKSPMPSFSDRGAHGLVVVEANVNSSGDVTSTRVISNATGDPDLAALAEREIRSAKFIAPIRDCVRRSFIFTYKRAF